MPSYRNQSIDLLNQLTGFNMMATLMLNDLKKKTSIELLTKISFSRSILSSRVLMTHLVS